MGRRRASVPRLREHNGRARVYWLGRWHYLGPAGSPDAESEYRRLVAIWQTDPQYVPRGRGSLLVGELLCAYGESADCPASRRAHVARVAELVEEDRPGDSVEGFGPAAFRAWLAWLGGRRDAAGDLAYSRTYVAMLAGTVRQVWKWGVATERIAVERWQALTAVTLPPRCGRAPKRVGAANPAHVDAALPAMRPPVRAMVELQRLTGMRPSELFGLTPAQVHRSGAVEVPDVGEVDPGPLGVWLYLPADPDGTPRHKTAGRGQSRWVILGERAQAVLAPFLDRGLDVPCFSPRESWEDMLAERARNRTTPAHVGNKRSGKPPKGAGSSYNKSQYRKAVRRACVKAGVPAFNPYTLRHRHAVDVDAEFGLDHAQASLGHTSPQMTRRYSKQSFTKAAEVARTMG